MEHWRAIDAHNGGAGRLKMGPWRVFKPVVADSHQFDEEQDPDPNPQKSRIRIQIRIRVKGGFRIRIEMTR